MKMSDDDSPLLRRGGRNRGRAPVIAPSPDSQSQRPSKFAVPPSPDDPAFLPLPLSSDVPPKTRFLGSDSGIDMSQGLGFLCKELKRECGDIS